MKIDKKVLYDFLKKIHINGGILEAVFDFTDSGLKISGKNQTNVTRVDGVLNSSAFVEYNGLGKIGVQEINNVIKIVNNFEKEITIKVEGNLLCLKEGSKKVEIELLELQFIEECNELPNLEFNETIKLKANDINNFIKDAAVNREFTLTFSTSEKSTTLMNDGKFKFTKVYDTPEAKGGVVIKLGSYFIDAVLGLTDELLMSIKSNYPIKMLEQTEKSTVVIVTAPLIYNNDKATSEQVKSDFVENTE